MANVEFILRLKDRVSKTAQRAQRSLDKITSSAQKASDAIDGIGLIAGGAAIAGIFQLGAELEQTTLFFNTLTGSVERGTKLFGELTQFANATPFSNQAINKNAQTLLSFGINAEKITNTLKILGDVAGGDQNRLASLTLAFGQVQSAGKLMGQDLLQFINVGFNPLQIIAEKTGQSMGELRKQMSKGAISAEAVRKAFEVATGPGGRFHNLTIQMSKTLAGRWSTAVGKAKFLIAEFGLSMKGVFAPIIDGIIKAVEFIGKFRTSLFPILKALVIFTGVVIGLIAALKIWVVVQGALNVLLTLNPIGLVVVAIAALIAIIVTAYNESETFRKFVNKTWNALQAFARGIKAILTPALAGLSRSFARMKDAIMATLSVFDFAIDMTVDFADVITNVLAGAIADILIPLQGFINIFSEIFTVIRKVSVIFKKLFIGDFAGAKAAFTDLAFTLKGFVEKRIKLLINSFGLLAAALRNIKKGNFKKAFEDASTGVKQLIFSPFGVDVQAIQKQAKEVAALTVKAFKESPIAPKIAVPGLDTLGGGGIGGFGNEFGKLQAEGVVSGGIKTFNINIGTLTGINTLTTTTAIEGGNRAGQSVLDELLKAVADIRPQ